MNKVTESIQALMMLISDHGNVALSKGIQWTGLTSVGVGGGLSVAKNQDLIATQEMMTLADWGIVMSMIGGATFIIKNLADLYFAYRRNKREEHERHHNDQ